jgi:hypothetical protein
MSYIYTSVEDAADEIARRSKDNALKREVEKFVKLVPEPMRVQPRAWLDRYIASPDHEAFQFLDKARRANLKPLFVESLGDRFHRENTDKMCLAEMVFLDEGSENIKKKQVINIKRSHMKAFTAIKTSWGTNFVEFHHALFAQFMSDVETYDASDWFHTQGKNAKEYYPGMLALFVCHGILFEDFITNADEQRFANEVVFPAFDSVEKRFGLRPLISRLYTDEELAMPFPWCYPESIELEVAKYAI